jgi:hypothetical protein
MANARMALASSLREDISPSCDYEKSKSVARKIFPAMAHLKARIFCYFPKRNSKMYIPDLSPGFKRSAILAQEIPIGNLDNPNQIYERIKIPNALTLIIFPFN